MGFIQEALSNVRLEELVPFFFVVVPSVPVLLFTKRAMSTSSPFGDTERWGVI
jgi:hypothetical protein